jgi:hypothetical protein
MRPLEPQDPETRQESTSVKKLKKGDAYWATCKVVLGWLLDTSSQHVGVGKTKSGWES